MKTTNKVLMAGSTALAAGGLIAFGAAPASAQAVCSTYSAGVLANPPQGTPGATDTACGAGAVASGGNSIAVGTSATATSSGSIAIGGDTNSGGVSATASGTGAIAIGSDASNGGSFGAQATGNFSVAIGDGSQAGGSNGIAIGVGANAGFANSVAIGANSTTTAANEANFGTLNLVTGGNATVGGALNVTGPSTFTGALTANGGVTTTTLTTSGNASVGGNLNVAGTLATAGAGPLTVADNLQVNGAINGGNGAGNTNIVGGANATETKIAAGTSYVDVTQTAVNIHGGTSSSNLLVNDAGFTFTNNNAGAVATANGTGAALFIAANGSISSTNAAVAGGAVNINDSLNVVNNLTVAGTGAFTGSLAANGGLTSGTINVNNATSGANKISGLASGTLSAASSDAVTGQQLFATNQAIVGLSAGLVSVNNRVDLLSRRVDKAYQGVAMGFAMNAAPLNLANGEGGISGGAGYFQGEFAGAIKAQYVTDSGVGLGLNVGFSADAVGGGVGASIKF